VNCEAVKDLLVLLNYGELSFEDEEAVEKHLEACPSCAAERRRLERLGTLLERQAADVSPDLLARCRRDLSGKLIQEGPRQTGFSLAAWWQGLSSAPWLKPAAALALLVVGFAGGKLVRPGQPQSATARPVMAQPASDRAQALAPASTETEDVPVSYEPPRQRGLPNEPNDARVRELLLAAVNDQDPALRVDSIDLLQHRCGDETVRKALLGALKADPNSGVRLKALEALRPYARNPETRVVLAGVVLNDASPAIRAQAIDLLVQSRGSDVASTLQEVLRREENPYIRERSVHALRAMKASTETF
jgi:hypothetical protein